jgi:hypothetical protein
MEHLRPNYKIKFFFPFVQAASLMQLSSSQSHVYKFIYLL